MNSLYFLSCFALLGHVLRFSWGLEKKILLEHALRPSWDLGKKNFVGACPSSFLGLRNDLHPFKEFYRFNMVWDDLHPLKESCRLFFMWTMYIHLRNLIVFSFS